MRVSLSCALAIVTLALASVAATAFAETEPEVCSREIQSRGVGRPGSSCPPGTERSGLLCYPVCRPGYAGSGPMCWQRCPAGYADDGATCRRNAHIMGSDNSRCPGHDKCGIVTARGCSTCPAGYKNDGCTCRKDVHIFGKSAYWRGGGVPFVCAPGEQYDAGLCYPKCRAGLDGTGPTCVERCPRDFPVSCGASCASSQLHCSVPVRPHMNSCTEPSAATACNGGPSLCDKRYDEVTFAASHNAFAVLNATPHISTASHSKNVTWQLRAGIRALMLDVHEYRGEVHLCHGSCHGGTWGTLESVLRSVRRFLDANPRETVTLIFEAGGGIRDVKIWEAFVRSGVDRYTYPSDEKSYPHTDKVKEWPKLSALGGKVVAFSGNHDRTTPIMPYLHFAFENPYSYLVPGDLAGPSSCKVDRGTATHPFEGTTTTKEVPSLFVMNHFTTPPAIGMGRTNNSRASILAHVEKCSRELRDKRPKPSFVVVDWADEGDVQGAVRHLNGLP